MRIYSVSVQGSVNLGILEFSTHFVLLLIVEETQFLGIKTEIRRGRTGRRNGTIPLNITLKRKFQSDYFT